jgi:hypothetical protein
MTTEKIAMVVIRFIPFHLVANSFMGTVCVAVRSANVRLFAERKATHLPTV